MNKIMLITGGGRGIGAATTRAAVREGYAVAITYVSDKTSAESLAEELRAENHKVIALQADVSKLADVERIFAQTTELLGPISVVVNNGGITGKSSRLEHATSQTIESTIAINLTGAIYVAREAVKHMSTRNGGKGGVIVNISSAAALLGSPGEYVWYAASKGGIDSLTTGLAKEVALEGIRVVSVTPGMINTEIHDKSTGDQSRVERIRPTIPMQRIGAAEDIANAILFLASDKANYITGTTLRVSGGR
jgi:NAD(P)-dependent dehydrogenase (short-subunit alcohol dehydrogenase family)